MYEDINSIKKKKNNKMIFKNHLLKKVVFLYVFFINQPHVEHYCLPLLPKI